MVDKKSIEDLEIKIFADGADKNVMLDMSRKSFISGLTTNPTLMNKAGITDYKAFCLDVLKDIKQKPLSFEVFSDDFDDMYRQAMEIASWGDNVYVKIPITNTKGQISSELVSRLANKKVKVNVTAIMTFNQVKAIASVLNPEVPSYISIFAGRIADTGVDPVKIVKPALEELSANPTCEVIWASPRELLNIYQANDIGCHIITVTSDILKKLDFIDYSLEDFSLDTVKMFYQDALKSGFSL